MLHVNFVRLLGPKVLAGSYVVPNLGMWKITYSMKAFTKTSFMEHKKTGMIEGWLANDYLCVSSSMITFVGVDYSSYIQFPVFF